MKDGRIACRPTALYLPFISRLWYGLLLCSCDSVYIHGSFKDQLPPYHDRNEEHYGPGSFLFDIRLQARLDRWLSDNEIPYLQD